VTRFQRPSPLPRFLGPLGGPGDASPGALELLGLRPAECTPAAIEAALERQLDRVAQHPEGDTPAGDEVRLALHAAAAQLRDPDVRRLLIEEGVQAGVRAAVEAGALPPSALYAAATAGGNGRAEHGVRPTPQPSYDRPPAPVREVPAPLPTFSTEPDPNTGVRRLLLVGGIGAGLLVMLLVVGLIVMTPSRPAATPAPAGGATASATPPSPAPAADAPDAASGVSAAGAGADGAVAGAPAKPATLTKPVRTQYVEASLVLKDLRDATAKAKADPAAGVRALAPAVARLADWWARYDVGERRAADDAVVEFFYVVGPDREQSAAALELLASRARLPEPGAALLDADAVWPAAWAAGVLTRLTLERELPRHLGAGVRAALNDALGAGRAATTPTFESGASASLARMPGLIVGAWEDAGSGGKGPGSTEALRRWCDAVEAVTRDPAEGERLLVDALERLLLAGPEPESDRAAFEAVELLASKVRWRAGGAGRERLLAWFADERITPGDLRVLTGAVAGKSSAEGVDPTMVLSITATPDDRVQLRARYALAWGMVSSDERKEALAQWRREADALLAAPAPSPDDLSRVLAVAAAARHNEAGRLLWLGDAAGAAKLMKETPDLLRLVASGQGTGPGAGVVGFPPAATPPTQTPAANPRGVGGSGLLGGGGPAGADTAAATWAEAYLRAERNIPVRLQRLSELETVPRPLSPADAAVLVQEAYLGSPEQVRSAAQKWVVKFNDDATVVKACLDQLPWPRVRSVSQTIEGVARTPLPRLSDPDWELAARRALVDRLVGMVASSGAEAAVDSAASVISECYARSSGVAAGPADESPAARATRAAAALYKLWRAEAERLPPVPGAPITPAQADRRRAGRARIAQGPLQEFGAEQVSICEVLGSIVAAERPARAADVSGVLATLAADRRAADHVLGQLLATERAMTRLWALRLGEVGS
jgi:hypothetical protein